ncbi:WD repeat-containing protein 5 [Galdieria sulphuraria]|nr:WD repeat-containing protein 5 [Galdieria sulphuraria]
MLKTTNSSSSDSFYKKQIEQLTKEKKQLKERLELLESENHDLRRSVFELSVSKASKEEVFDLDVALIPTNEDNNEYRTSTNTSFEGYLHNMEWDWKDPSKGESGSFSRFGWKFDLAGHLGAVYVVEFSKCGRLIGSGSQDKSLRIWQLDKPTEPALLLMDAHTSSISDLCWNSDSTNLATCGYDRQVKEWSLEEGATIKWLASYSLSGLVQNVEFCKGQPQLLVASTSQGNIHMLDRRTQKSTNVITNDCSVNSIYVHYDGILVTSGDHRGYIKRWDMRYFSKPLEVFYNSKRPISHLEVSRPREEEEGQYLAVNAFDNTIRVYDRGGYLLGSSCTDSLKLLHTLKGIKSQNWPIRCSFYQGADFLRFIKSGLSSKDRLDTREGNPLSGISFSNSVANQTSNIHSLVPLSNYRPQETLTLASGSADGNIYIYDVGQPEVCFHPTEPIFASCSADYLIKIWVPVKSKSHAI